ncbi:hypothetical protein SprV_0100359600 [Sparganum proliferum]
MSLPRTTVVANTCSIPETDLPIVYDPGDSQPSQPLIQKRYFEMSHQLAFLYHDPACSFQQTPELIWPNQKVSTRFDAPHNMWTCSHAASTRPHRLAPVYLATAENEFKHMIQLSEFPWASPFHRIPKAIVAPRSSEETTGRGKRSLLLIADMTPISRTFILPEEASSGLFSNFPLPMFSPRCG